MTTYCSAQGAPEDTPIQGYLNEDLSGGKASFGHVQGQEFRSGGREWGAALRREDVWEGKWGSTAQSTSTEQEGSRERQARKAADHGGPCALGLWGLEHSRVIAGRTFLRTVRSTHCCVKDRQQGPQEEAGGPEASVVPWLRSNDPVFTDRRKLRALGKRPKVPQV